MPDPLPSLADISTSLEMLYYFLIHFVFLDEVLYAISCDLLPESVLTRFLDAKPEGLEVILTGNDPSEEVRKRADYVSRIVKEKHPYDRGLHARSGIEY